MPPSLDFTALLTTEGLISLITLSVLEIVLGIDNIIVISILSGELPTRAEQRRRYEFERLCATGYTVCCGVGGGAKK